MHSPSEIAVIALGSKDWNVFTIIPKDLAISSAVCMKYLYSTLFLSCKGLANSEEKMGGEPGISRKALRSFKLVVVVSWIIGR